MISIVIPAYNEAKYLGACLESLAQQKTKQAFEVIVVDNASTDKTAEIAQAFRKRLPLIVIHEANKGRGPARAAGFAAARGEIILSTDADATLPPNWIDLMSAPFSDQNIIGVTGTCYIADQPALANFIFNFVQPAATFLYRLIYGNFWLLGSNSAIRKTSYTQAGGFNLILNSQEDTQLSRQLHKYGKITQVRSSCVETSGRRYDRGIIIGLLEYVRSFLERFLLRRQNIHLRDAR